jgi:hypothetical protein
LCGFFRLGRRGSLVRIQSPRPVTYVSGIHSLGLETAWKRYNTILVIDGGGKMQAEAEPKGDWTRHALRINEIIDNQVRSLRKRQVVGAFATGERKGAYWGIRSHIGDYHLPGSLRGVSREDDHLGESEDPVEAVGDGGSGRLINGAMGSAMPRSGSGWMLDCSRLSSSHVRQRDWINTDAEVIAKLHSKRNVSVEVGCAPL